MTEDEIQLERFPRRTLRRQQTRAKIMTAALNLFIEDGYGAATMNAIAAAADVHVTTLFTHFKSKRDLAISLNDASIARLEQMVEESKGVVPFFVFFRNLVLGTASQIGRSTDPEFSLWHELRRDPELTFAWVQYEQRQIALLTHYIAFEYRLDAATDYRPELVADLMLSSAWISHRRWSDDARALDLTQETRTAVEIAIGMAEAILER